VSAGEPSLETATFRHVMSHFASGVSVVSTVDEAGRAHGMTVNALTSVSLDPLLVLFCCEKDASLHAPLLRSGSWAVSMLTLDQADVSQWFSARERRGTDQFAALEVRPGRHTGASILDEALAWLECRTWATYDGGDHTIVVGEVVAAGVIDAEAAPLLYYKSSYLTTTRATT
jgi:flavin reductase (DIM6/NTAB) family NADH-FMN oxidoreductase RutF